MYVKGIKHIFKAVINGATEVAFFPNHCQLFTLSLIRHPQGIYILLNDGFAKNTEIGVSQGMHKNEEYLILTIDFIPFELPKVASFDSFIRIFFVLILQVERFVIESLLILS